MTLLDEIERLKEENLALRKENNEFLSQQDRFHYWKEVMTEVYKENSKTFIKIFPVRLVNYLLQPEI